MISKRIQKIDSSELRAAFAQAQKIQNSINFSIGFPAIDTPKTIKQAGIKAIEDGFTKYMPTDGLPALKEKILKKLKKQNKLKIKGINNITVTPGVTGAFAAIYISLFDPQDEVIIFDPYFLIYKELCKIVDAKPVIIDTYPTFQIDLKQVEKKITQKTKAIVINSPNNPTGVIYPKETLIKLAKIAQKNNLIVISDEIYEEFCYQKRHFSIGSVYENTLTLNGFSKTYGMTGWRLGYVAGPEEIISAINEIQPYLFFSSSSVAQMAAIKALDMNVKKTIDLHKKLHDFALKNLSPKFEICGGDGAFYFLLKAPNGNGKKFVQAALKRKLIMLPGTLFSEKNTHFGISYATSAENLKKGIKILNELAEKY